MSECPPLEAIDGAREHLASCASCRVVVELLAERKRVVKVDECARFEVLLAAREEGTIGGTAGVLLDAHLRECAACAAVAATMPPTSERREHSALPAVSTAAYALGREVARGGMGRILAAEDLRIGRKVAVKELLGKAPSLAARFEREARVTARLQHPAIVPIYEIGKWPDGTPFYAMRMVDGQTLRETIRGGKTLDDRLALVPAVIAAAEAVAFAHGQRVIHRDLTPNNILVGAHGDTVVIDWGLAKDLTAKVDDLPVGPYRDEPVGENLTTVGAVIGTAAYMPPEQASGQSVDERADVYALGAILYHVLAGEAPYRASKSEDIVRQVQAGPPPVLPAGAPRDLVSIVGKAMNRERGDRYATAGELVAELRRFQTGRLVEAHHYSRVDRARRWIGAHRVAVFTTAAALAAIAIAGSIGVVGVLRERDRAETGEEEATRQRIAAETSSAALLEELGQRELLAGNPKRATAFLSAAYSAGDTSTSLRFMLRSAMLDVESIELSLVGDTHDVLDVAFSRNGKQLAVAHGKVVDLWSLPEGARSAQLADAGAWMKAANYSADGRALVTSGTDGVVRAWDTRTGGLVRSLRIEHVFVALPSDDGRRVLVVQEDGNARRWDVVTGVVTTVASLGAMRRDRAWSGWSRYLVATGDPARARVWDWQRDEHPPPGSGWRIARAFEVDPTGTRFVMCDDNDAAVWDATGAKLAAWRSADKITTCTFTPDGARVLAGDVTGHAIAWDASTGLVVLNVSLGTAGHGVLAVDDRRMLVVIPDGDVDVRDLSTGTRLAAFERTSSVPAFDRQGLVAIPREHGVVDLVRIGRDRLAGRYFRAQHAGEIVDAGGEHVLSHDGATATLWSLRTGRAVATLGWPAAVSPGPKPRVVGMRDGVAVIVDATSGAQVGRVDVRGLVDELSLDAAGDRLLALRAGQPGRVWRASDGTQIAELPIECCGALTPDGAHVVRFEQFKSLELFPLDGRPRELLSTHPFLWAVDPTGRRIAWSQDEPGDFYAGKLVVEDIATGAHVVEGSMAWGAAFDRTGELLCLGHPDDLALWNLPVSRTTVATTSVDDWARSAGLALSPGGELVATPYGVWSASDGRRLATFVPPWQAGQEGRNSQGEPAMSFDLFAAWFSDDGHSFGSFSPHTDATLWDTSLETRPPAEIARIVEKRVPWRVENGRLVAP